MGGHEDHDEADQDHQVEVVQIPGFREQEHIGEGEEEEGRADAIQEAGQHEEGQDSQAEEVVVDAVAGPRRHPVEARVREEKLRRDEGSLDPAVMKISQAFPDHDRAENDPEVDERRRLKAQGRKLTALEILEEERL